MVKFVGLTGSMSPDVQATCADRLFPDLQACLPGFDTLGLRADKADEDVLIDCRVEF